MRFTRTEYAILELLAENHGKPVSRECMLRTVWQFGKKIGDDAGHSCWIRNLPGIDHTIECMIDDRPEEE